MSSADSCEGGALGTPGSTVFLQDVLLISCICIQCFSQGVLTPSHGQCSRNSSFTDSPVKEPQLEFHHFLITVLYYETTAAGNL